VLRVRASTKAKPYRALGGVPLPGRDTAAPVFAVETEPGIQVLLYDLSGTQGCRLAGRGRARLFVPHSGVAEDTGTHSTLMQPGRRNSYALDRRGCGQNRPAWCHTHGYQFYPEDPLYLHAAAGTMLGKPLLGRMVHDVMSVTTLLVSIGHDSVDMVGRGCGSLVAALAALLHPGIRRVTLVNAPRSLQELGEGPVLAWPFSHLPRDLLRRCDLPDVYRVLRRKNLKLFQPWDRFMRPLHKAR
jgi:pimeloyl-ACP methyl ester carboxylesterase